MVAIVARLSASTSLFCSLTAQKKQGTAAQQSEQFRTISGSRQVFRLAFLGFLLFFAGWHGGCKTYEMAGAGEGTVLQEWERNHGHK